MIARLLILTVLCGCGSCAAADAFELDLQRRDRITGEIRISREKVDPARVAIVVVDMWNWHWCKTSTARVAALVPRMKKVLDAAHEMGMTIFWCPSDVADNYAGTPQHEAAMNVERLPLPALLELKCPPAPDGGGCTCGKERCRVNYGWDGMHPGLRMYEGDLMPNDLETLYSLCKQRGVTHVIYLGVHTQVCLLGKSIGLLNMTRAGFKCILARDLTDAHGKYDPDSGITPDAFTAEVVAHFEKHLAPTINFADELRQAGKWDKTWTVDPVRITPWGTRGRPHLFEEQIVVTLTTPWQPQAKIYYTLDGSVPGPNSCPYTGPFMVAATTSVRAAAFEGSEQVCLESVGYFARLTPLPPKPDVHLSDLKPMRAVGPGHSPSSSDHRFSPVSSAPQKDRSNRQQTLRLRGAEFTKGMGVHAPNQLIYELTAEYDRFVALAGVDDHILDINHGSNLGMYPSVVFKVFVDGKLLAASPVMRIGEQPWRFNLPIPPGSRRISLVASDADDGNREDLANWVDAGFVRKQTVAVSSNNRAATVDVPQEAPVGAKPLAPTQSLKHFQVADDLELEQVLAEPIVTQPVFLNFDERGRMWVVQYRRYPFPAGLKVVSHDSVWRVVYDKVPPPPPNHFKGADKITIHEDTDGDGTFDKHKTFVDELNMVTAVERGRGGVWILNPPYLLFYPDANQDDVPDGDPVVHLSGFGLEDGHSVVNSLRWGPDGWLYSSQGSTVTANIIRPGLDEKPIARTVGQQIWRYHPPTRRFEVFAEGGGNAFGCEMDSQGRIFSGHNGGDTRGFHYDQGAYLQKGFDKHGPLSNPYAFGYFPAMAHHSVARFTHNFVIYEGAALPEPYVGKLFGVEPIQGRIVLSEFAPDKSSFRTRDLRRVLTSDDRWFRPVDIKTGPDGAIYICDWYDQQINHYRNHEGQIDVSNGRVYRLKSRDARGGPFIDLSKLTSPQLAATLNHSNKWVRQTALRLLADRKDKSIVPALETLVKSSTGQQALEALWALNLTSDIFSFRTEETKVRAGKISALDLLDHPDPFVRLWTVRLLCDEQKVSEPLAAKLARLAQAETNLEVRKQLAASARRLPAKQGLAIVRNLVSHDEDAADNRMPLMLWWAVEAQCEKNRDQVLGLFSEPALWSRPLMEGHLLERLMRRFAHAGTRADLLACARLLELSPSAPHSKRLMAGFEAAFKGRSIAGLPDPLLEAMARHGALSDALRLRQGEQAAVEKALQSIADDKANLQERLEYLQILSEIKIPASVPLLLKIFEFGTNQALRRAALGALQTYPDPEIGKKVVALYPKLNQEVLASAQTLLASRAGWLLDLARSVDAGRIAREGVPVNMVRQAKKEGSAELAALAHKLWPHTSIPTNQEMEGQMADLAKVIRAGSGNPYNGRTLFQRTCAACHTLFGQGGHAGPDLTSYQRNDLESMLLNIVHPNGEVREGYETYAVETKDGRSLLGFLADQDKEIIVLRGVDDQNATLARSEISELRREALSLMPEGLLDSMNPQEVRDLFAYLRSTQPLVGSPPAITPGQKN